MRTQLATGALISTCIAGICFSQSASIPPQLSRFTYPLSRAIPCPPVSVDTSDMPEQKAWGETAKGLVEAWFSKITELLSTEDWKAPKEIKLVIKKEISAPAYTSGNTITINGKWITQHPDDLGMVVHELVHVVQSYPGSRTKPGWLVEGIADYVRWWRYEPEYFATHGRPRIDPEKSKYTDSYRTTAYWLAWCSKKYDMGLVPALDKALRNREDPMPLFAKLTGKDADALWKEFLESKP
jgi:hypothetical protein